LLYLAAAAATGGAASVDFSILNTLPLHVPHVADVAFLPFFIITAFGSLKGAALRHLKQ